MANFRDRLWEALEPYQTDDNTGHLYLLCDAIGAMFQPVEDLASDTDDGHPGWTILLDIDRIPAAYLGYLAQFVGVRLLTGLSDTAQRERVRNTDGWQRGRPAAILAAARQHLTGAQNAFIRERYGSAWKYLVVTFTSETPDSNQTLADLMAQKPGPDILVYEVRHGQDWQQVKTTYATWQSVKNAYATWEDVRDS